MSIKIRLLILLLISSHAHPDLWAIINYGKDNDANTSDPGFGAPWSHVARLTNATDTVREASAVYLGDRFLLTADHVDPNAKRTHVTFDGATTWEIEPGSHQQVTAGVDLKVIRLLADPGLPPLMLYEDAQASEDLSNASVLVGWGRGRDPSVAPGTDLVPWGDNSTIAKRWGTNTTLDTARTISYDVYNYEAVQTRLLNTAGPDEAGMTLFDSGGALFQEIGGEWYLSGIATTVERTGESYFGASSGPPFSLGDRNSFVRISTYSDDVYAAIPESSAGAAFTGLGAFVLALAAGGRRFRIKRKNRREGRVKEEKVD